MKLFWGLFLAIILSGCEVITAVDQRPFIDVKLIGVWKGEYLEEGGTLRRWIQTRNADGTYAIEFSFTEVSGATKSFTESGRWWIQDGLFHEIALPDKEQPDKYQYSFKANACVSFVLAESEGGNGYAFSECLEADSPPATISGSI